MRRRVAAKLAARSSRHRPLARRPEIARETRRRSRTQIVMMLPNATANVQDFYERYPYPPPVESLERYRSLWEDGQLRRQEHHLFWPARPYRDDHSILVAGCGTAQAAKYAIRWPNAHVTGIDFSTESVRCTEALKRTHNLENLDVRRLSLERAAELDMRFDRIVCTGVLHHLADPVAGLRALRDVLEPD